MTVASDKIVKVNRITCANVDGTNAADLSLSVVKANFTPDDQTLTRLELFK